MARLISTLLVLACSSLTSATAQDGKTESAAVPGEVNVNFLNGSNVRLVIRAEALEVATPYGKLTVPIRDIRAVEFGVHFPEGVAARVDVAIRHLGSDNYREREKAVRTLAEIGPLAYPALQEASHAHDLETANRARDVIKRLQATHAKKDLKTSIEDRVVTPSFTIVGRIVTPVLKAKTEYFGEVDLRLSSMRTLRAVAGPSQEVEVSVDAVKYANAGQWLETRFHSDGKSALVITAKGVVDTWPQQPGQYLVGPNGVQAARVGVVGGIVLGGGRRVGPIVGQTHGGMLLGKVGEDGEPFLIGDRYDGTPESEGPLFLHIGPSPWNCPSSGAYDVKISRKGDGR